MAAATHIKDEIRRVLQDVMPNEPEHVNEILTRIMAIVDPVDQIAREELERYRETFAGLAK